jgi:hypothetical protein
MQNNLSSFLTDEFVFCFRRLPKYVKKGARKNYRIWKKDSSHPGLDFKKVHTVKEIYSVRIGTGWRALAYKKSETIIWFWIGSHADYDKILSQL